MTSAGVTLLVIAAVLVVVAAILASAEAALSSISRVRAEELARDGRRGAAKLLVVVTDAPRFLNTALLLRILCETTATVLVTLVVAGATTTGGTRGGLLDPTWLQVLLAAGVMVVVSYIAVGVGPRTLGRQHSERVGLMTAGAVSALTAVLGPIPQLLIVIGNALTPGKGFREGPFATEAELRDLVDLAEQSRVIESGESRMIHSVFELGDTLAREVMVPRTDMVFIERYKTLRQMMSLALRSGFSRIPVVGENLDDVVGVAYLKDVTKRVFDRHEAETTERIETVMRPSIFVPDSKPADELMRDMQARRMHVAIVVDEYGGTAGLVTIEDLLEEIVGEITDEYDSEPLAVEHLASGAVRVSSRLPLDELGELFGVDIDDEDIETVGGLMAKHLGRVPIPGAEVTCEGLHLQAEALAGRRNKIVTVLVRVLGDSASGYDDVEEQTPVEVEHAESQG
ncbi:MAG: HlyC/CorC family transporter [Propionibacteriales bacterium]|nr:HlyC/CorC family transporter [Propionibacteriales bacterium]